MNDKINDNFTHLLGNKIAVSQQNLIKIGTRMMHGIILIIDDNADNNAL